jgi:hypothetical protein
MANILGIHGLTTINQSVLISAYGNDLVNMGTGLGYSQNITPNQNVEMEMFLNSLFFQNYIDTPRTFDGTSWTNKHVSRLPISKYIKRWNSRLYIGYVKIAGTDYPSRVWFSDLSKNNTITWGYETRTNLQTTAGSPTVFSAFAGFKTYNIKRGDPFLILTGPNAGEYIIQTIDADQQLTLTEPMKVDSSGDTYYCGGNFFDVARDDGDYLTWIGENNSYFYQQLLLYKRDSLFRYDGSRLVPVQGAFGTTSGRSVINIHELSLYFYGSGGLTTGIYSYDNQQSKKISAAVEHHIQGISPTMYDKVIGWRERDLARMYVGNIVNTTYGINVPNAVITWDYNTHAWSVDPIAHFVTCAT